MNRAHCQNESSLVIHASQPRKQDSLDLHCRFQLLRHDNSPRRKDSQSKEIDRWKMEGPVFCCVHFGVEVFARRYHSKKVKIFTHLLLQSLSSRCYYCFGGFMSWLTVVIKASSFSRPAENPVRMKDWCTVEIYKITVNWCLKGNRQWQ